MSFLSIQPADGFGQFLYREGQSVVFKDDPLAHGKPEWAAVTANGTVWTDGEELGWANPFRPEVWDYNIELSVEVLVKASS